MTDQAWDQKDLQNNPHAAEDKPSRVRRMFEAIAPHIPAQCRLLASPSKRPLMIT